MKKHIELNKKNSSFTGNATWYYGLAHWAKDKEKTIDTFLSISDCYHTIRLHPRMEQIKKDKKPYIAKLKRLVKFIQGYIYYLEKQNFDEIK